MVRMIFDDTEKGALPRVIIEAEGTSEDVISGITCMLKQFMTNLSDNDKEMFQAILKHFIVEGHDE